MRNGICIVIICVGVGGGVTVGVGVALGVGGDAPASAGAGDPLVGAGVSAEGAVAEAVENFPAASARSIFSTG